MNAETQQTNRTSIGKHGEREIRIERIFNASRERVWAAITDPAKVAQWWGGGGMTVERMDVRRGGYWRFVGPGSTGMEGFGGRYREVTPPSRIVQTFEWDGMPGHVSVETAELEEMSDGRTRFVCVSTFHTSEERDGMLGSGMEGGLNLSYAALDEVLAAG
jgi:uncharacterized protein YndB with AHSA1/START domain